MPVESFETLLTAFHPALERWVHFHVSSVADAEDLIQDICLAAYQNFQQLRSEEAFRPWILGIARRKYADWCRLKAHRPEILLDVLPESPAEAAEEPPVWETLEKLPEKDRLMLLLFYRDALPQKQISQQLRIPEGTVKSRLHTARSRFRSAYPYPPKGDKKMPKLPKTLPPYTIAPRADAPFSVEWRELMGWCIVPREGERLLWGMYDLPSRKLDVAYDMTVTGRARVHGIEGVEIKARVIPPDQPLAEDDRMNEPVECSGAGSEEWTFVAQMTEDRTRFLSAEHREGDVRELCTFLDGDEFMQNWGCGPDNQGNPIFLKAQGKIRRDGSAVTCLPGASLVDVVGRYDLTLDGKTYDTICVMDVNAFMEGIVSEQFLTRDGLTVLWRRFNPDDWALDRYGKTWSQLLPDNERLTVNGKTYVHWYDCLYVR